MLILTGEYELTLDSKKRVMIPAKVREAIDPEADGRAFYLVLDVSKILSLYPDRYYERVVAVTLSSSVPVDESLTFDRIHYALTCRVEPDGVGRILIPQRSAERAGLGRELSLIGVRDHLELWNRAAWQRYVKEKLPLRDRLLVRARHAQLTSQGRGAHTS